MTRRFPKGDTLGRKAFMLFIGLEAVLRTGARKDPAGIRGAPTTPPVPVVVVSSPARPSHFSISS